METLIIGALVVALGGLIATIPLMLHIARMIDRRTGGIGTILVEQLLVDKLMLLAIAAWGVSRLWRGGHMSMEVVLVLALALAVTPLVLIVRWRRWQRRENQ